MIAKRARFCYDTVVSQGRRTPPTRGMGDGMAAFWITVVGVFALDRAVKVAALNWLTLGQRVVLWPGVLEWRLTRNHGMALGFLSGNTLAIIVLPILVVALGWLTLRRYQTTPFTRTAAALLLGGFLGNLLDRLHFGYVLDMIYFPWMPWYICNLADIAICAGVLLLAISLLWRPGDWRPRMEEKADATQDTHRGA